MNKLIKKYLIRLTNILTHKIISEKINFQDVTGGMYKA